MRDKSLCILVTLISACIIYISISEEVIEYNNYFSIDNTVKYVDSDVLEYVIEESSIVDDTKEVNLEDVSNYDVVEEPFFEITDEIVEEETIDAVVFQESNEVVFGRMSGYGPDCIGCSGYLAYGKYVGDGNIYYDDAEFGKVRIVAGDKKYKFGTIVKINDSFLAIVLDRGGSIGVGKKFLFDLLYESEAESYKHGVSNDVKFEILRNGF